MTSDGLHVIDVDTHITEPHDLWTSRAPAAIADRVPHVVHGDDGPQWVVDDVVLGRAGASSVVRPDGSKCRGAEFTRWTFDDTHPAAYDVGARVAMMDEMGIYAQILYPNVAGFGAHRFGDIADEDLKVACATIFNDAMAEMQEQSGGRLFPMALLPWWNVDASVAETRRAASLGLRGVNMCSDPHLRGAPDLGEREWDPLWEACCELDLPVNFHIGASESSIGWFGSSPWPSQGDDQKLAVGSAMMYLTNARVFANLIFSGVLERFPELSVVSVESGIGWIPFVLESLDHQLVETAPSSMHELTMKPSEYFHRQVYACFWFERHGPAELIDAIGVDNVLFETDFPHPTCLYPDSLTHAMDALAGVDPVVKRKVLQDNAARLYNITLPDSRP